MTSIRQTWLRCLLMMVVATAAFVPNAAIAQGAFSHSIPIKLPKGANGVQPELALVYRPGAGNGIVGMGWELAGLPYITRVDYENAIGYAGTDTYAHSTLGILVRQSDGSYRTKKETFTKFMPSGTCGDAPCSWLAISRSGLKHYYGTSGNSAFYGKTSAIKMWGIASVVDLFGNAYNVTYSNSQSEFGALALSPTRVSFTGGPGVVASREVAFEYENAS